MPDLNGFDFAVRLDKVANFLWNLYLLGFFLLPGLCFGCGLLPLILATGIGSEIQRPLAIVVVGGLTSSTLLTLIVIPTLYLWINSKMSISEKL